MKYSGVRELAGALQECSNSLMEFRCEDLPQFGVVLVPPESAEYRHLLADIQRRIDCPVEGSPPLPDSMRPRILEEDRETSAILLNRSQHGIAAIQQVWSFQEANGRTYTSSIGGGSNPSVLLPFGLSEKMLKLYGYWQVILPGSKRYLGRNGKLVGDNTDVRSPGTEEVWKGGVGSAGGGGGRTHDPLEKLTLTLDGVFFDDGGFVGPNQKGLWEQVVRSAEAHLRLARIAREGHDAGDPPQRILAEIESVTGPATEHPPVPPPPRGGAEGIATSELQKLAWQIRMARKSQGDERTVYMILAWANEPLPQFRKL